MKQYPRGSRHPFNFLKRLFGIFARPTDDEDAGLDKGGWYLINEPRILRHASIRSRKFSSFPRGGFLHIAAPGNCARDDSTAKWRRKAQKEVDENESYVLRGISRKRQTHARQIYTDTTKKHVPNVINHGEKSQSN